ncbi:hypothetical protein V6N13_102493 [Hibiscus sabdariffa]|uniref:Protein E6-like n=1 Tax=Hibiscus sabdariffa TaxID=183260 RepID=A0ABR2D4M3_9ROSI
MAASVNHIVFFFFIVLSSSVQIQAREGKFFSKIIHLGAKITALVEPTPSQAVAPVLAPAPAPAPEPAFIDNQEPYYGLYGHGSAMFPTTEEGVTVTTGNTPTTTSTFGNSLLADELADEKYETGYEKNNYDTVSNYNSNGYERERQGMSDTRFVEGGKYYYDVKNENYYPNGYEYSSSKEASTNEGYYGNTDNSNQFNSMQDEYRERQEEYVP